MNQKQRDGLLLLDAIMKHQSRYNLRLPYSDIIEQMKTENKLPDGTHVFYSDAFDKLLTDGYFKIKDGYYYLSFEGLLFSAQGGYLGEIARNESDKNNYAALQEGQRRLGVRSFWLTAVIAIGTGIAAFYYLWSIYVYYHPAIQSIKKAP